MEAPQRMLHDDWQQRLSNFPIKPYMDPSLRTKKGMISLGARLWRAGMLREVDEALCFVAIFTMIKKVVEGGAHILRLITDLRQVNSAFRTPPWVPLSGPGSLCGMGCG